MEDALAHYMLPCRFVPVVGFDPSRSEQGVIASMHDRQCHEPIITCEPMSTQNNVKGLHIRLVIDLK